MSITDAAPTTDNPKKTRTRRRKPGQESNLPALPSPLDADDREILLWLHDQPREAVTTPPAGFSYGHMAACRRKLVRLGLAAFDCPPGDRPTVFLLTRAGETAAQTERERRTPPIRTSSKRGRSKND